MGWSSISPTTFSGASRSAVQIAITLAMKPRQPATPPTIRRIIREGRLSCGLAFPSRSRRAVPDQVELAGGRLGGERPSLPRRSRFPDWGQSVSPPPSVFEAGKARGRAGRPCPDGRRGRVPRRLPAAGAGSRSRCAHRRSSTHTSVICGSIGSRPLGCCCGTVKGCGRQSEHSETAASALRSLVRRLGIAERARRLEAANGSKPASGPEKTMSTPRTQSSNLTMGRTEVYS